MPLSRRWFIRYRVRVASVKTRLDDRDVDRREPVAARDAEEAEHIDERWVQKSHVARSHATRTARSYMY